VTAERIPEGRETRTSPSSEPGLDHEWVGSGTGVPPETPLRFALPLSVRFGNARGVESTGAAVLFVFPCLRQGTQ
jgi:hypothetical protein